MIRLEIFTCSNESIIKVFCTYLQQRLDSFRALFVLILSTLFFLVASSVDLLCRNAGKKCRNIHYVSSGTKPVFFQSKM